MFRVAMACVVLATVPAIAAAPAGAVVVGFDDQASGTVVAEQYAGLGVHFGPSAFGGTSDTLTAVARPGQARSGPNVGAFAYNAGDDFSSTWIRFDKKQRKVTFYACRTGGAGDPAQPNVNVDAYDAAGTQIDSQQGIPCNLNGPLVQVTVEKPAITYIHVGGTGGSAAPGAGWALDDLEFETDPPQPPPPPPGGGPAPGPCANTASGSNVTGTAAGDVLLGTAGRDRLRGLAGDDCLFGRADADTLEGGSGNDDILGEAGNDLIDGGSGDDSIRGDGMCPPGASDMKFCTVGGLGDDRIFGGTGDDTVNGDGGKDRLSGQAGDDRLRGQSGNDVVSGGSGRDILTGSSGNDRLSGSTGADRLLGGSGRDSLTGGSGADEFDGGSGNDSIHARDNERDHIRCGSGRDSVTADRNDKVSSDCERVARR